MHFIPSSLEGPHHVQDDQHTAKLDPDQQVLAFFSGKVGTFGLLVSLAAILGMMSQSAPVDALKLSNEGAYTLTLFSLPILAVITIAQSWLGTRHAIIAIRNKDKGRIPVHWRVPGLACSHLRKYVALTSFMICFCVPLLGVTWSFGKMLHGSYYYMPIDRGGCNPRQKTNELCKNEGAIIDHFWPKEGVGNPLQTKYAHEGNKDFVPGYEPIFFGVMLVGAFASTVRFVVAIQRRP